MTKRIFDIFFSCFGMVLLLPLFIIISIIIKFTSKGSIFYTQKRVGKNFTVFKLYKFRTMLPGSEQFGQITIGKKDRRITPFGLLLRKYKLDELPQLINIFLGQMSFVGPRPEVPKYVQLYNQRQRLVLSVKPGLTDFASIRYSNENELLEKYNDPEKAYIEIILPAKLELNLAYIEGMKLSLDLKILWHTLRKIFR